MPNATEVLFEVDGPIARIRFDTPDGGMNLMSTPILAIIEKRLDEIAQRPEIRVVIFTGNERVFMAGGDINELKAAPAAVGKALSQRGQQCMNKIATFEHAVTIAAISGSVVGGGFALALSCDIRIMAENAKLGFPEVRLGLIPAWGGVQRAFAFMGPARIRRLVFTGHLFDGKKAAENGLVNEAVPADKVMETAEAIAREVLKNGPQAVRLAKRVLCAHEESWLEPGWIKEAETFGEVFLGDEAREGMSAFLEKRPPKWAPAE